MLMPKKVKYRKQMRGRRNGKAWRGGDLAFGEYGLKPWNARGSPTGRSKRRAWRLRVHQARRKIVDPDFPGQAVHQEAAETRMGKGKGAPEKWVAVVKPGRIMFEMAEWTKRRPRKPWGGGAQAADSHQVRLPCRRVLTMPRRIEKIREAGRGRTARAGKDLTEMIFRLRSSFRRDSEALKRSVKAKKDLAR